MAEKGEQTQEDGWLTYWIKQGLWFIDRTSKFWIVALVVYFLIWGARLDLCQLLEIEDFTSFETVSPDDALPDRFSFPEDVDAVVDASMSLPQEKMAALDIDIARRDIRIAQAAYYPTVSPSAAYRSSYSDARQKAFQNTNGTYRYDAYPFLEQYYDNANSRSMSPRHWKPPHAMN